MGYLHFSCLYTQDTLYKKKATLPMEGELRTALSNEQLPMTAPEKIREQFSEYVQNLVKDIAEETPEEILIELMSGIKPIKTQVKVGGHDLATKRRRKKREVLDLDAIQKIVLLRATRATSRLVRDMSYEGALKSVSAATDIGVLATALSNNIALEELAEADPFAGAVGRALDHKRSLIKEAGEMLTTGQVEVLLNVSRQAIDKRRKAAKIFGLLVNKAWVYPAFQFANDDVLPGMEIVLSTLADTDQWVVLDLLLAKDEAFGRRSLLDVIRKNDVATLKRYAAQQAGDGFS